MMTPEEYGRAWDAAIRAYEVQASTTPSLWRVGCEPEPVQTEHQARHARGVTVYDRVLFRASGIRLD